MKAYDPIRAERSAKRNGGCVKAIMFSFFIAIIIILGGGALMVMAV